MGGDYHCFYRKYLIVQQNITDPRFLFTETVKDPENEEKKALNFYIQVSFK